MPAALSLGPICEHSHRSRSLSGRLSARAPAARLPRLSSARGYPLQGKGHRLSVDQNDPAIAGGHDLRQVALHDGVAGAVVGQRLEHDVAVLVALFQNEYGSPSHAVQGLAYRFAVLAQEFAHVVHVAGDEGGRAALGKPGRVHLLVHVPQALRPVADQRALALRTIQNVRGVDVLGVEGRILAHQNHVEFTQFGVLRLAAHKPRLGIVEHLERRQTPPGDAVAQPKVLLLRVEELPAARLRRQQYCQRAVLGGLDRFNGVHDHDETDSGRHAHSFLEAPKNRKRISQRRSLAHAHIAGRHSSS